MPSNCTGRENAALSNLSPDAEIPTGFVPLQNVPAHSLQMITDWMCAEPRVILSHGLCCFCESRVQPHGVRARSSCVVGLRTSIVPTCFPLQRQQFSLIKSYFFFALQVDVQAETWWGSTPAPRLQAVRGVCVSRSADDVFPLPCLAGSLWWSLPER